MANSIKRRGFLRGAGSTVVGLPFLASLPSGSSNAEPVGSAPKRLFILVNPHPARSGIKPSSTGSDYSMPEVLEPLESHRDDMLVVSGLNLASGLDQSGNPHAKASSHLLTGASSPPNNAEKALSISVDQYLAEQIGGDTAFRSLELGIMNTGSSGHQFVSHGPGGTNMPHENDPAKVFDRVFGDGFAPGGDGPAAPSDDMVRNASVLDHVMDDYQSLKGKLSSDDRQRLDIHLESLRELERQIEQFGDAPAGASCELPDIGPAVAHLDHANMPQVIRQQFGLSAMALACDRTRIITLSQGARTGTRHPYIPGANDGLHPISHKNNSANTLNAVRRFYAEELRGFIDQLAAMVDHDGSRVLDNTMVAWMCEIGNAAGTHDLRDMVFVVIGGKNLGLDLGQHLRFDGRPHNDFLTSMLQAMGLPDQSFGTPKYNEGPLPIFT